MELRVMTYNIHHGVGADKKFDIDRIGEIIKKSKADLIGLNEVDVHFSKRSNFMDQASYLAEFLGMNKMFGPAISIQTSPDSPPRQYGNLLLTRYPIIKSKYYSFNFPIGIENRSLIEATIQIKNKPFQAFVTHLSLNRFAHRQQTNQILQCIAKTNLPTVLLGDWNMKPRSTPYIQVSQVLEDAWINKEDPGYTYPSYKPSSRLDYIFIKGAINVLRAEVEKEAIVASDHLPLIVTLETAE